VRPPSRRNNEEDIQDTLKETTTLLFSRKIATAAYNMWQGRCQLKYVLPVIIGNASQREVCLEAEPPGDELCQFHADCL